MSLRQPTDSAFLPRRVLLTGLGLLAMGLLVVLVSREKEIRTLWAAQPLVPEAQRELVFGVELDPVNGLLLFTPDEVRAMRTAAVAPVPGCEVLDPAHQAELATTLADFMTLLNEFALYKDGAELSDEGFRLMVGQQRTRLLRRADALGEAGCVEGVRRWMDDEVALSVRLERSIETLQRVFAGEG